jgi:hypothetical protein
MKPFFQMPERKIRTHAEANESLSIATEPFTGRNEYSRTGYPF